MAQTVLKHGILKVGLVLIVIGAVLPVFICQAQEHVKKEWGLPDHFPEGFDGWGHIERLTDEEVVIDDTLMDLSLQAEFNTLTKRNVSRTEINIGSITGFIKNTKNEIISIWLIQDNKP
jgi:hypothetical protein